MADVFPKFIVEGDTLVIAKCTYHYQIVNDKEKVKGGGWWRKDGDNFILHGSSHDFGSATLEDIKNCINKGNVFTDKYNVRNISKTHKFSYDTGTEIIELLPIPTEPPTPVNKSEGEGIEEEAEVLVEKFKPFAHGYETVASGGQLLQNAKQCALIHCDLMLNINCNYFFSPHMYANFTGYYQQLKEAINKL